MAKTKVTLTYERTFEADFGDMREGHVAALAMAMEEHGALGGWSLQDMSPTTDDWKVVKVKAGDVEIGG